MTQRLGSNAVVVTLARDLGVRSRGDALAGIVRHARRQVVAIAKQCKCQTLSELLRAVAVSVDTLFIEIHSDDDLARVRAEYLGYGEVAFIDLAHQLSSNVFAITFRRLKPRPQDRRFVSVIDCRGDKAPRAYFSKWHEIAHLLTLTSQQRLKFCRSHEPNETKDPEESVMDVIAGEIGFLSEMVSPHIDEHPTFDLLSKLRTELCPDASQQASLTGLTNAWGRPCLYIEAELKLRRSEERALSQSLLPFADRPQPTLRATVVWPNQAARQSGLFIPTNFRVPEQSAINVSYLNLSSVEADEDLAWWSSSKGEHLQETPIRVSARRVGSKAQALISVL